MMIEIIASVTNSMRAITISSPVRNNRTTIANSAISVARLMIGLVILRAPPPSPIPARNILQAIPMISFVGALPSVKPPAC